MNIPKCVRVSGSNLPYEIQKWPNNDRSKANKGIKTKGQSYPRFQKCRTLCFEDDETVTNKQFNKSEVIKGY